MGRLPDFLEKSLVLDMTVRSWRELNNFKTYCKPYAILVYLFFFLLVLLHVDIVDIFLVCLLLTVPIIKCM